MLKDLPSWPRGARRGLTGYYQYEYIQIYHSTTLVKYYLGSLSLDDTHLLALGHGKRSTRSRTASRFPALTPLILLPGRLGFTAVSLVVLAALLTTHFMAVALSSLCTLLLGLVVEWPWRPWGPSTCALFSFVKVSVSSRALSSVF